jgi:hypothetical protein
MLNYLKERREEQASEEQKKWYEKYRLQLEQQQRMRPRLEENEDAPDKYLVNVFYKSFLKTKPHHVGVYTTVDGVGYWIGLVDPPVFYMFDEITVEEFQKYIPVETTETRWNSFTNLYNQRVTVPQKHFSYSCVFRTLLEKKYIQEVDDAANILDESLEAAAKVFLKETPEKTVEEKNEILQDAAKFEAWTRKVTEMIARQHAFEHVNGAWVFTEAFWNMAKQFEK